AREDGGASRFKLASSHSFPPLRLRHKPGRLSAVCPAREIKARKYVSLHKCRNEIVTNSGTKSLQMPERNRHKLRNEIVTNAGKVEKGA
ncbi:MAG: hypothetical protein U0K28_01795, partial [Prevotellamassilia sp.]|nr:hypothetical protein [Prevotellamassilia sp.]